MSNKILMLGRLVNSGGLAQKNFIIGNVFFGNLTDGFLFMSLIPDGNKIKISTEKTYERPDENDVNWADEITFKYNVSQIIRKKPIASIADGVFEWTHKPLALLSADERSIYVKLENGDLYEVILSRVPYKISDTSKYEVVSKNKMAVGKKISENCSVIVEGVYNGKGSLYFEEYEDDYSVKTGSGTAPVIKPFKIDDNWIGITAYPNPVYATFLAFKKSDYDNALNSTDSSELTLYLLAHTNKGQKTLDITFLSDGVKKAILFRDNDGNDKFLILTNDGEVYKDNDLVGSGKDIGVYWTEVKSLNAGCLNNTPILAQKRYLDIGCAYSNYDKAHTYCSNQQNAWGGFGLKSVKQDPQYRTAFVRSCQCRWYQDAQNVFTNAMKIGVPIWQDSNGKWHSVTSGYKCYDCDGTHAKKTCGETNQEVKEIIEAIDFFMQNMQKDNLLISKGVNGEFYEVPVIGYLPARVTYAKNDKIKLSF